MCFPFQMKVVFTLRYLVVILFHVLGGHLWLPEAATFAQLEKNCCAELGSTMGVGREGSSNMDQRKVINLK